MSRTVAVDFDGVIHAYSKGWQDGTIYDEPLPGALDALRMLMAEYAVFVHTTRDDVAVCRWLENHGISTITDAGVGYPEFWNDQDAVLVTNRKLPAMAYIDDRGIRFESWDQALADLARYEP